MILPPLPETHLNNRVDKFYTAADMHFYGEACIKAVCGSGKRGVAKKFDDDQVRVIRNLQEKGDGYKEINKWYPMSRELYFRIIGHKGAYK